MNLTRRLFLTFFCLFAVASVIRATPVTVASITLPDYQMNGATCSLKLYASDSWTDSTGIRRIGGAVGSAQFFQTVAGTVADKVCTIPAFVLQSTTDAIDNPNVRITAGIYDATGSKKGIYLDSFQVPISLGTAITWAQITVYNRTAARPPTPTFYNSADQINAVIQQQIANVSTSDATTAAGGKVKLTTAPNTPTNPVAVSATDPNYLSLKQTPNAASYTSFANAVSSVAAAFAAPNTSVLAVSQSANVTANLTVPANVALKFDGTGTLNISSGQTVSVANGAGLQASDDAQIFSGAGKVLFTGSYPSVWHPEWFGAKGDNVTDDLPAFNKMIAAMARAGVSASNGRIAGGNIQLALGKTYYLSNTLRIDVPVYLHADGGDRFTAGSGLRFPGNVTGIIVDGAYTTGLPGQDPARLGQFSRFENFAITGGTSVNNAVVDIASDFTMTLKNTGAITQASTRGQGTAAALPPGSTVTVSGATYTVNQNEAGSPSATISIDKPRLFVTTYGVVSNQFGLNGAFATNDWIGSTIAINGTNYTITALDPSHITINASINFTGDAEIQNITPKTNQPARLNIYHGLNPLISMDAKGLRIYGFSGNGLNLNSEQFPAPYLGSEPNNDLSTFSHLSLEFNAGSAIVIYGVNSQPMQFDSCTMEYSNGWAVYEEGSSGVVFTAPHANQNQSGAYRLAGQSATSLMLMPYVEGGQPTSRFSNTIAINPINLGLDQNNGSLNILHGINGQIGSDSGFVYSRGVGNYAGTPNTKALMTRIGSFNGQNEFFSWGVGEDTFNTGNGNPVTSAAVATWIMGYDQLKRGWASLYFGGNYATDQGASVLAFSHDAASEGGGKLWFQNGFYVGRFDQGKRRNWQFVSAIPTTGTVDLGDIFWNNGAGVGTTAPVGWVATTAGTIGSTAVLTPFGSAASPLTLTSTAAGQIPLTVQLASGQTGNPFQILPFGSSTPVFRVAPGGAVYSNQKRVGEYIVGDGLNYLGDPSVPLSLSSNSTIYFRSAGDAIVAGTSPNGLFLGSSIDNGLARAAVGVVKITDGGAGFGALLTGGLNFNRTVTATGTTGAQTINKPNGRVNFAAGANSLVVTNSLVNSTSSIIAVVQTNDTTAYVKNVVPGAGTFTITLGANATAETAVSFWVFN